MVGHTLARSYTLYVQRDDDEKGLTHFHSLGIRFLTLIEFHVRRKLEETDSSLVGLHLEILKKRPCFYSGALIGTVQ